MTAFVHAAGASASTLSRSSLTTNTCASRTSSFTAATTTIAHIRSTTRRCQYMSMQAIDGEGDISTDTNADFDAEYRDAPPRRSEGRSSQYEGGVEEAKLFIGNLSWNTTDVSLGDAFADYGTIIDSKVVMDKFTGRSRGFGFVTFSDAGAASAALEEMNGVEVDGRPIRIDRANKRVGGGRPRREEY